MATTEIMACLNQSGEAREIEAALRRSALPCPAMASRAEHKEQARAQRLASEDAARRGDRRRAAIMRLGLVLGLAVVVVVAAIVLSSGGGRAAGVAKGAGGSDAAAGAALFDGIPQRGVTLGRRSAGATLIEFADLQCPYCAEYSDAALPTVVKDYVRTGRLRYELRLRSFLGQDSARAAGAAAAAAKQNRLYEFADLFYRRQRTENTGYVTDGFLRGVAGGAGVDPARAVAAAHAPASQPLVAGAERLASSLGSSSTPAFYLRLKGGRLVPLQPRDLTGPAISQAIDAALPAT
jgi:protein-disulfide isomerase